MKLLADGPVELPVRVVLTTKLSLPDFISKPVALTPVPAMVTVSLKLKFTAPPPGVVTAEKNGAIIHVVFATVIRGGGKSKSVRHWLRGAVTEKVGQPRTRFSELATNLTHLCSKLSHGKPKLRRKRKANN